MKLMSTIAVGASLVGLAVLIHYHSARPASATVYCAGCVSSYLGGPYQPTGTAWVFCCIDFDGIPPPHCCVTERQERLEYEADQRTPVGYMFKYYCPGATPTASTCSSQGCS